MCLLFPLLATKVANPILEELFGYSYTVLSMNVLTTMAVMLVSVLHCTYNNGLCYPYGNGENWCRFT